ncbi:MAG TPA: glycoside hydrolase family 15 protein [Alphaproteobacteria bacterium]|nr:glycoside hydrolase family 15 protein [Alphaproteobacteria bacterium]
MTASLNLAVIGNAILGALVDPDGKIVWCCFPRLDGDPVFCGLLSTEDEGIFDVDLVDRVKSEQSYIVNTAVVVTTLSDRMGGVVRITDFVPRFQHYERTFRPTLLVRRVEPIAGTPRVRVRIRPRFNYGATKPAVTHGSNHIRYQSADTALRISTDAPITYILEEAPFILASPVTFILGPDEPIAGSIGGQARDYLERTVEYWQEWSRYLSVPFEWQDAVIRAAITLKLCSYEETGAIVAALTTSIPEHPDSGRNWDYRFCWLRDAYFVVQALNRLGATSTMEDFILYITNVAMLEPEGRLRPVYGVVPGAPLDERIAPALAGYRGMGPVRIGNQAAIQIQNDSYGSAVLAAAQMFFDHRLPIRGDRALFERLERLGERAAALALEPDAGLWEFRGRERVHTHSVVMCWAACDRLAKIARVLGLGERSEHWRGEAQRLRRAILDNAWNASLNTFVSEFGGKDVDACLLLLHEVGFLAPNDQRFISTVDTIRRELWRDGHLLRYATEDDFGRPRTAFNVCSFWFIDALTAIGRRDEAREMFERLLACRSPLGLLSEDLDPKTGELWGNFPQTYSMVGLIVSAMRLSKSWEEAFWRGS